MPTEELMSLAAKWNRSADDLDAMADRAAGRGAAGFRIDSVATKAEAYRKCAGELLAALDTASMHSEG